MENFEPNLANSAEADAYMPDMTKKKEYDLDKLIQNLEYEPESGTTPPKSIEIWLNDITNPDRLVSQNLLKNLKRLVDIYLKGKIESKRFHNVRTNLSSCVDSFCQRLSWETVLETYLRDGYLTREQVDVLKNCPAQIDVVVDDVYEGQAMAKADNEMSRQEGRQRNESAKSPAKASTLDGSTQKDPLSVWIQLYVSGEKFGFAFRIQPCPVDADALTKAVKKEWGDGLSCAAPLLTVFPAGTSVPIQDGTDSLDPGDTIPSGTTSKKPLIVLVPQEKERQPQGGLKDFLQYFLLLLILLLLVKQLLVEHHSTPNDSCNL